MKHREIIAVYGTLRSGEGNHYLLEGAQLVATGRTTEKFVMYGGGFPICVPAEQVPHEHPTQIVVEVYSVSSDVLKTVDSLEGYPGWYSRKRVRVDAGAQHWHPYMYFMTSPQQRDTIRSGDWIRR